MAIDTMTSFPYLQDRESTAVPLLAHGGSHTQRDQPPPTQTPTVTPSQPTSQSPQNGYPVRHNQPVIPPAESIQREPNSQHLMESVLGLPFGLGELSLAAILVVPLTLIALKRILQS